MFKSHIRSFLGQISLPFMRAFDGGGAGGGAGAGDSASAGAGAAAGAAAGAGAGAAGAAGAGAGAGAAGAAGARGTGAAGAGAGAVGSHYRLSDDSMVDLGDGRMGRWGDLRQSHYMPREQYTRGVELMQRAADALDAREKALLRQGGQGQGNGQGQGQGERPDPFGKFRNLAVADGNALVELSEALRSTHLAPLAGAVMQMAQRMQQMETQLQGTQRVAGQFDEQQQEGRFQDFLTTSFGKLGEIKGLPSGATIDAKDPHLRALAEDLYKSFDPASWRAGDFERMLTERISESIAFVARLQKAAVEHAESDRRAFLNGNRGNGRPSGEARAPFLKGGDIAAMAFRGVQPTSPGVARRGAA